MILADITFQVILTFEIILTFLYRFLSHWIFSLNYFQDRPFLGSSRMEGAKNHPLLKVRYTYTWHNYILPNKDPKNT